MYKLNAEVIITQNSSNGWIHYFPIGTKCIIKGVVGYNNYILSDGNNIQRVNKGCFILNKQKTKTKTMTNVQLDTIITAEVMNVAKELAKANNTFTTLEIKNELIKRVPQIRWTQYMVSSKMNDFANMHLFTYTDNGTFRTYSLINSYSIPLTNSNSVSVSSKISYPGLRGKKVPKRNGVKRVSLSRTKAKELMQNSKGHFFTVEFIKKDNTLRKLNGQYMKDQKNSSSNYILLKEASKLKAKDKEPIRNVNLNTLRYLKINGIEYNIR